ncbi:hypothetical protein IM40_05805 [Candidatus Paracaedimonas acanthamoebae]|nr:hypothetical protein IM40_05805 [Candidatus Paracaedimonas acanthamoebae]
MVIYTKTLSMIIALTVGTLEIHGTEEQEHRRISRAELQRSDSPPPQRPNEELCHKCVELKQQGKQPPRNCYKCEEFNRDGMEVYWHDDRKDAAMQKLLNPSSSTPPSSPQSHSTVRGNSPLGGEIQANTRHSPSSSGSQPSRNSGGEISSSSSSDGTPTQPYWKTPKDN